MFRSKKFLYVSLTFFIFLVVLGYTARHTINQWLIANNYKYYSAPESDLAHILLDGLKGIEIAGTAHNTFGLDALNIDSTADLDTPSKQLEIKRCGTYKKVDIVAPGDRLPLPDNAVDYVISSHIIDRFYDPIKTVHEWLRVTKPSGYVYIIAPHKECFYGKDVPRTTLAELIDRHKHPHPPIPDHQGHYSIWTTEDFLELAQHQKWNVIAWQDVDDKVGDGFTVVIQK